MRLELLENAIVKVESIRIAPTPGYSGRGPVLITHEGNEYGPLEIDHVEHDDPGPCVSAFMTPDRRLLRVYYKLDEISGLKPEHLPYLKHTEGGYRFRRNKG